MGLGLTILAVAWPRGKEGRIALSPSGVPWPTLVGPDGKLEFGKRATWGTFSVRRDRQHYAEMARRIAKAHGVPPDGVVAQFWYESRYNPVIESRVGAQGISQFMPLSAIQFGLMRGVTSSQRAEYSRQYQAGKDVGGSEGNRMRLEASRWLASQPGVVDRRTDPEASIEAGVVYMKELYEKYGSWATALGAYNWGPGNMDRAIRNGTRAPEGPQKYMAYLAPYYHSETSDALVSAEIQNRATWT